MYGSPRWFVMHKEELVELLVGSRCCVTLWLLQFSFGPRALIVTSRIHQRQRPIGSRLFSHLSQHSRRTQKEEGIGWWWSTA